MGSAKLLLLFLRARNSLYTCSQTKKEIYMRKWSRLNKMITDNDVKRTVIALEKIAVELTQLRLTTEQNKYLGHNVNKLVSIAEKMNWNLGTIATPSLGEEYPEDKKKFEGHGDWSNGNSEN